MELPYAADRCGGPAFRDMSELGESGAMSNIQGISRLRNCIAGMTRIIDAAGNEADILARGEVALARLIAVDDWLPESCAKPDETSYRQYLLHCDPLERFSIVSFVWGPGQKTPIHDHTVWGLVGVLRGAEIERRYVRRGNTFVAGDEERLGPGSVARLSPADGDVHQVSNAFSAQVSISVHIYGANIGKVARHVFDRETGIPKTFISGYSNSEVPNVWV
jgi:3-mercaptopropionate dioxygenase